MYFVRVFLSCDFYRRSFSFNLRWGNEICFTLSCSRNSLLCIEPENSLLCLQDWPPVWAMTLYACDTIHMPCRDMTHTCEYSAYWQCYDILCVYLAGCTLCIDRRGVLSAAGETQTFHAGFTPPVSILITAADWLVQILQNVLLKEAIGLLVLEVWHVWVVCLFFVITNHIHILFLYCCGLCASRWLDIRIFDRKV